MALHCRALLVILLSYSLVYRSLITRYRRIRLHFHFFFSFLASRRLLLLVCNFNDCHLNEFEIVKLILLKMVICATFGTTLYCTMEFLREDEDCKLIRISWTSHNHRDDFSAQNWHANACSIIKHAQGRIWSNISFKWKGEGTEQKRGTNLIWYSVKPYDVSMNDERILSKDNVIHNERKYLCNLLK